MKVARDEAKTLREFRRMTRKSLADQAEAAFKKTQDGAQARADHHAAWHAVRDKTARLRALRLAKEAAERNGGSKASP
jgi:hypothetical protein